MELSMPRRLIPNGMKIKAIRAERETGFKQSDVAERARLSIRTLRRIENENSPTMEPDLRRLANTLGVPLDEIVFSFDRPRIVGASTIPDTPVGGGTEEVVEESERWILMPRYDTAYVRPLSGGAPELVRLAESAQEIAPHILVDADPERFALIDELLNILMRLSSERWSSNARAESDQYDDLPFPQVGRLKRLSELLVLLKGNDILVCAETHNRYVPDGELPRVGNVDWYFQLLVAFIPPDEYGDHRAEIPVDHGRDIRIPEKPIF